MYKVKNNEQSFLDFNQPLGLHMNPENLWIKLAAIVSWDRYEKEYSRYFKSHTGNVAKPFRMVLGALIIQKKYGYSDRELVEVITENPYLQYFVGLPGYQETPPFDPTTLVNFRKRISIDMAIVMNEILLAQEEAERREQQSEEDLLRRKILVSIHLACIKASGEIKTRTVHQTQKNGDIYVIERQTQYDPVRKYNKVISSRIVGKIQKGETTVVPMRPKRRSGEKVSNSALPVSTAPVVTASRRKAGMMDIIDHIGRASGIDDAICSSTDRGTALKILSLARYLHDLHPPDTRIHPAGPSSHPTNTNSRIPDLCSRYHIADLPGTTSRYRTPTFRCLSRFDLTTWDSQPSLNSP